jgi:hypothetical protein
MSDAPTTSQTAGGTPSRVPTRDELPLTKYDDLQLGDLGHRIRSLDVQGLETVLAYERAHAHRAHVVRLLTTRLDEVRRGEPTSDGDPSAPSALAAPPADAGSVVQPATSGPVINPPSHGDPTNPAQPR